MEKSREIESQGEDKKKYEIHNFGSSHSGEKEKKPQRKKKKEIVHGKKRRRKEFK